MPNPDWNPEKTLREFRVKSVRRFIVTDWKDYRDGSQGVRTIAECESVGQANEIAETFGARYPGSLVNPMDPEMIEAWDNAPPQPLPLADPGRPVPRHGSGPAHTGQHEGPPRAD